MAGTTTEAEDVVRRFIDEIVVDRDYELAGELIAEAHGWTIDMGRGSDGGVRLEFTGVDRPER